MAKDKERAKAEEWAQAAMSDLSPGQALAPGFLVFDRPVAWHVPVVAMSPHLRLSGPRFVVQRL